MISYNEFEKLYIKKNATFPTANELNSPGWKS